MRINIGFPIPDLATLPGPSRPGFPVPGGSLVITYPSNAFCPSASDPTPTVSGNVGAGTFSSTAGLVFVSTSTGQIDVGASTPNATAYTITYTDTNSAEATFSVTLNALDDAGFSYSASSFPQNASNPTPTITGLAGGTFSSTSGLVFVSTSTGEIDLSASTIGSYTITYNTSTSGSSVCPNTSNVSLAVGAGALAKIDNVYSMVFDGTDDYVDLGDFTSVLGTTSKFSTSLWCNWQSGSNPNKNGMLNFAPALIGGSGTKFDVRFENASSIKITINNSPTRTFSITPSISSDWMHIAFTYDGTLSSGSADFDGVKLYINGVDTTGTTAVNALPATINFATMFGFLGFAQNFNEGRLWNGLIDETAIFNVALTQVQVTDIYNATKIVGGVNKTADLSKLSTPPVAWYRMGD